MAESLAQKFGGALNYIFGRPYCMLLSVQNRLLGFFFQGLQGIVHPRTQLNVGSLEDLERGDRKRPSSGGGSPGSGHDSKRIKP